MATSPLGVDLDCGTDLSPTLGLVSGRTALAQAMLRRLSTPRGKLERHPTYGVDLPGYLSETLTTGTLLGLQQAIRFQALEDERVLTALVSVETIGMRKLVVRLDLSDAAGPFRLVFEVTKLTVALLEAA